MEGDKGGVMRYGAVCVCGVWCVGGAMWLDGIPRVSPQHASHPAARRGLRRLRHTKTDSKQEGGDSISRGWRWGNVRGKFAYGVQRGRQASLTDCRLSLPPFAPPRPRQSRGIKEHVERAARARPAVRCARLSALHSYRVRMRPLWYTCGLRGKLNIIIKNRGPGCSARGQTRGVLAGGSAIALKALSESPHHLAHLAAPGTAPGAKWQRRRPEQQLQALSLRRATSLPAAPDNGHRMPERRWSRREQLKTKSKFGARASLLPVPKFVRLYQLADLTAAKELGEARSRKPTQEGNLRPVRFVRCST